MANVKNKRHIIIPKNPRKANLWDSASINSTLEKVSQILYNIEYITEQTGNLTNDLPDTPVPVVFLQEVCENYIFLYNKLLKENLLITANPKSNLNIH